MNDDELHRLLRKAPAQVLLSASFEREVWLRIEAESSLTFRNYLGRLIRSLFVILARPLPAFLTIASFFALGALLGGWSQVDHAETAEMAYVESIQLPLPQSGEKGQP